MIATVLALTIAAQPAVRVIEVPEPGAGRVTIAAVLRVPELDPLGRASADVLSQVIVSDNGKYSKQEMRDLCAPGGHPRSHVMADHIAIELAVLPADTAAGMRMLASMVMAARMRLSVMNSYLLSEPYRHKSVWSLALDSQERAWDRLRAEDISNLYKWVCRPDNITIAVGGDLRQGQAQAAWDEASRDWKRQVTVPLRKSVPFKEFPKSFPSHALELRGPEVMPNDKSLPAKLVALVALGSGKSSSLFLDIRSREALSYRQEAVLWPTQKGFLPRLLVQIRPESFEEETKTISGIRTMLIDSVSRWNDSTLQRAQGYATALVTNGTDFSPLYFRPRSPLGMSIEDHTLLAAYWQMKTGSNWNGEFWAESFKGLDLQSIKTEASNMLKTAFPVLHPTPKTPN